MVTFIICLVIYLAGIVTTVFLMWFCDCMDHPHREQLEYPDDDDLVSYIWSLLSWAAAVFFGFYLIIVFTLRFLTNLRNPFYEDD